MSSKAALCCHSAYTLPCARIVTTTCSRSFSLGTVALASPICSAGNENAVLLLRQARSHACCNACRFTRNEFCLESKSTIGVEFATRSIQVRVFIGICPSTLRSNQGLHAPRWTGRRSRRRFGTRRGRSGTVPSLAPTTGGQWVHYWSMTSRKGVGGEFLPLHMAEHIPAT